MLTNRLSKSCSLMCVFNGQLISSSSNTKGLCSNSNAPPFKSFHGKFKPKTICSDSVFLWNFYICITYGMGVGRTNPHFIFFWTNGNAFPIAFNNKGIDSFMPLVFVRMSNHKLNGRFSAICNPVFYTIQYIMITFVYGCCSLGCCITSGFGFRKAKTAYRFPRS